MADTARASYFIKNLPDEMLTQLMTTSEFYDVLDELRRKGYYPVPNIGKRPKRLSKGIPEDFFRQKALEQFEPPPDISVRIMNVEQEKEGGDSLQAGYNQEVYDEEVTLAKVAYDAPENLDVGGHLRKSRRSRRLMTWSQ